MKKLIRAEAFMVALAAIVVILGHAFGWSMDAVVLVVAILALATAYAASSAAFVAVVASVFVVAFASAFAAAYAEDLQLKYRWVLLSLLVEGAAIWTIFKYF